MTAKTWVQVFFIFCFAFSFWIMFHTFSYHNGEISIASKAWSDFGSHLPLIRSFSFGWNFPAEYPLFSNEPIHYHFIFYAFVGLLEKIGIPLDFALNIPSALGFFTLLVAIYLFAKALFKSAFVGILSVLFFLFNGSLSFLYFLKDNPINPYFFSAIVNNTSFPSFHPYGDGLVSAFWNLNIYTNQRHLAPAFTFSLLILLIALTPILHKKIVNGISISTILGILLGLSFYFHIAAFGMTIIMLILFGIFFSKIRLSTIIIVLFAGTIAYPQYTYMNSATNAFHTIIQIGYLVPPPITMQSFMQYWALNLGLHLLLIPIGFILTSGVNKKIFLSFFVFFILGNIFKFSPEIAANHKFFNYFMLVGNMLSAYVLYLLWKKSFLLKPLVILLFFLLTFSGIVDFFPIANDGKIRIADYKVNSDVMWILNHTPKNSVFLNTTLFLPQESIAGRKIFLGWPYFAWSQGYDTDKRGKIRDRILSSISKNEICNLLQENDLSYIEINRREAENPDQPKISGVFQNEFYLEYKSEQIEIYNTAKSCK